jgi:type II protein arginine methyltransferase
VIILSEMNAGNHSRGGEAAYSQYIRHLEKTSPAVQAVQSAGTVENFAQGYQDFLQAPLQVSFLFIFHERLSEVMLLAIKG